MFACWLLNQFCKQLRGSNTSATLLHRGSGSAASFSLAEHKQGVCGRVLLGGALHSFLRLFLRGSVGFALHLLHLCVISWSTAGEKAGPLNHSRAWRLPVTRESTLQRHHQPLHHLPPWATVYCCFMFFSVSFYSSSLMSLFATLMSKNIYTASVLLELPYRSKTTSDYWPTEYQSCIISNYKYKPLCNY